MKDKYILAYMDMAERFGLTSACERLKVGALLVKNGAPIACGCNGTPAGFETNVCELNGVTRTEVNHAEINCLNKLRMTNDTSTGSTLFVSHAPCLMCAHEIVDAGVSIVYYRHTYRMTDGVDYLRSHGVTVTQLPE
jgi:dCMP deaminase